VVEMPEVTLDASALDKVKELSEYDRKAIFDEFKAANAQQTIRNPSGWIYGRARTKLAAKAKRGG